MLREDDGIRTRKNVCLEGRWPTEWPSSPCVAFATLATTASIAPFGVAPSRRIELRWQVLEARLFPEDRIGVTDGT